MGLTILVTATKASGLSGARIFTSTVLGSMIISVENYRSAIFVAASLKAKARIDAT